VNAAAEYAGEHLVKEPPIVVHGKPCKQRRNIAFFGVHPLLPAAVLWLTLRSGGRDGGGGFAGWTYNYSKGSSWTGLPIEGTPLEALLDDVNTRLGAHFNAILVNQYEDPSTTEKPHCIGDHCERPSPFSCLAGVDISSADNEDGLCPFQGVATVSHGAKRTMKFKCKLTGALAKEVELLPYSILHMKGKSFQKVSPTSLFCCCNG